MASIRIIALCVATAICYGTILDQVTARICVEYFTIGHPMVIPTTDPTLLGLVWGVLATWWMGVLIGIPLAAACRLGRWPKREPGELVRPLLRLAAVSLAGAAAAGAVGFVVGQMGWVVLLPPLSSRVPAERHIYFLVDLWAHSASYLCGSIGGLVLMRSVIRSRRGASLDQGLTIDPNCFT